MPSKRSLNDTKKQTRAIKRSKTQTPAPSETILEPGAKNDIAGVLVAVVGIILLIAVLLPSSALLTEAASNVLHLALGLGAIIVPLVLILWSITFFVHSDSTLPVRAGIGFIIITLALIGFLSLYTPGAEVSPHALFEQNLLIERGGYVGSALAFVLFTLIGKTAASVVLVGLVLLGFIVLGFSLSGFVDGILNKIDERKQLAYEREIDREYEQAQQTSINYDEAESARPRLLDKAKALFAPKKTEAFEYEEHALSDTDEKSPERAQTTYLGTRTKTQLRPEKKSENKKGTKRSNKKQEESSSKKSQTKSSPATESSSPSATEGFDLPSPKLLVSKTTHFKLTPEQELELNHTQERLQETLETFGMTARVVGWTAGPTVTTFRISMGDGERVSKLTNLEDDIALSLAAPAVRIFSPIPGTSLVGVEIPNSNRSTVTLGDVMPFVKGGPLMLAIGRDVEGNPRTADLAKMPHLLIAGTTGSGKSVMINSILSTILMRATPDEVRLIMVDPKRVELSGYNGIPQLYVPVVTDPRQAASSLQWAVAEMERRLKVFEKAGARNIASFNHMVQSGKFEEDDVKPDEMPYLVIVIDELTDLMMVAGKDVEASIVRISQLGRAAGIHLIVATQRPAAEVVTNAIKVNIVNRIAFKVATSVDSRVILGQAGAEKLIGLGDMLFDDGHSMKPARIQGCYVSDEEINSICEHLREQGEPEYHEEILSVVLPSQASAQSLGASGSSEDDDPLIWDAAQIIMETQMGSTSGLQRRLRVGYARAGRIMDMLEEKGIVGPADGTKPREILVTEDELRQIRALEMSDEASLDGEM